MTRFLILSRRAINSYMAQLRQRKYDRIAERAEKRRKIIQDQIEYRKDNHREFRPLYGTLKDATCTALAAECGRDWPDLSKLFPDKRQEQRVRESF